MKIDFANLKKQYLKMEKEIDESIKKVLTSTKFILGNEVNELEDKLKEFVGSKYAITTSSGTDALILSLLTIGLKKDDEVIVPVFTFIATAEAVSLLGGKPVFVDIDEETYNIDISKIEEKITEKTKAIIPVSLYGQPADMDEINEIAKKYNIVVIEDGAQSFGAHYKNRKSCNLSHIGCTSFFPAKPLGCYGDGGAVFTNIKEFYEKIKSLRVHGQIRRYEHKFIGLNGRLDTIQAAILLVKLKYFPEEIKLREKVANLYFEFLKDNPHIKLPKIKKDRNSVWAQFSIRVKDREKVIKFLNEKGIPTAIHYPKPLHLQECFKYLGYKKGDFPISEKISSEILSLPMNPYLVEDEINYICENLNNITLTS